MKFYTRPRKLGEIPLGAILMLPLFGLPLGAWMVEQGRVNFGLCSMKSKFGVPCLSCGATRATVNLFHGHVFTAIALQPMMLLIYAILLVWGGLSLWGFALNQRVVMHLGDREDMALKVIVVAVPILNWIYLYKMGI